MDDKRRKNEKEKSEERNTCGRALEQFLMPILVLKSSTSCKLLLKNLRCRDFGFSSQRISAPSSSFAAISTVFHKRPTLLLKHNCAYKLKHISLKFQIYIYYTNFRWNEQRKACKTYLFDGP